MARCDAEELIARVGERRAPQEEDEERRRQLKLVRYAMGRVAMLLNPPS